MIKLKKECDVTSPYMYNRLFYEPLVVLMTDSCSEATATLPSNEQYAESELLTYLQIQPKAFVSECHTLRMDNMQRAKMLMAC